MVKNSLDLAESSKSFLNEFNLFCKDNNLLGKVKADHIGLKCSSKEVYELQRSYFEFESRFIYQSIISKRRISIIGLTQGLETTVGPLNYLELSDQKPDGSQKDIIDHLEIVPVTTTYEELVRHLQAQGVKLKEVVRPHHTTYDIVLTSGFIVRLSPTMLVDKIKEEEMV
jgi:predicted metalloenzyme YecM